MSDQRSASALGRIERALARIEAAAAAPAAGASGETERLREAHGALRREVEGAIGRIDHLLAAEGQG